MTGKHMRLNRLFTGLPRICFAGVIPLLAMMTFGIAARLEAAEDVLVLANKTLSIAFDKNTFACRSIRDVRTDHEFICSLPENPTIWVLAMEGPNKETFSVTSTANCVRSYEFKTDDRCLVMKWKGIGVGDESRKLDVKVIVELKPNADRSYWRIEVNNSSKSSLMSVQFPYIAGISEAGRPNAAIPGPNWGKLHRNLTQANGVYPSFNWPMQFLALLDGDSGLYLAYEDPKAWHKSFDLVTGQYFAFTTVAEDATRPGNDFSSPGPAAVGICGGDWWKACKMFRSWAIKQKWTRNGPLTKNKVVPQSAKDICIWFLERVSSDSDLVTKLRKAQDYYGVPIAVHCYQWHRWPFDTHYPDYFPAKPEFNKLVEAMVPADVVIAPYVNARLHDMNIDLFEESKQWCVKNAKLEPTLEDYGSGAKLTAMCPYTRYWQDKMNEVSERLFGEYGVNCIYYDQVAAAHASACYDPSHGHPLGGGSHWVDGYRAMFARVNKLRHKGGRHSMICTEGNTDCYMDCFDSFLIWLPRHPDEIPMITAVYSGYTNYFGSTVRCSEELQSFAMMAGRDFIWGCQNGWMPVEVDSERANYLRRLAHLRYAARKYLTYGELMGEIKPTNDVGMAEGKWSLHGWDSTEFSDVKIPAVMSTVWKSSDGTLGLFIANFTDKPKSFNYNLNPADYGVKVTRDESLRLTDIKKECRTALETVSAMTLEREEKLAPFEVRVIELTVASRP